MHRPLFLHIVSAFEARYEYFRFREDASGRPGLSPIQECTAAIRKLAYGGATDMFDEYLHIGETISRECLMNLHGRVHGFPGMLGNIDCTHWEWKNCPVAYTTGFKGKNPTMILESVDDYQLSIWHEYFGVVGSNNDINVLQSSSLFNEQCLGVGPTISFVANGNQHDMGYYLADGIYTTWLVFVKTIRCPTDPKKIYLAQ
ncbi:uncharacterized protein LOC125188233 [Salvia hispanica]|uniref:uncharacterized protein LOC125188233 n=1 Tax=Salvia hispanica TaxID=49212 RepID=UPI002009AA55|nr:uncharacterized protein LOC125188233 [Salvia hispanica]